MCERLHAVEREGELDVHRLLDPKGAVVVEGGDAFGKRDELGISLRRGRLHEPDDRLLGGPSFQDGSGSDCACAEVGRSVPDKAGSSAKVESRARRSMPGEGMIGFMLGSFQRPGDATIFWRPGEARRGPIIRSLGLDVLDPFIVLSPESVSGPV